jgi:four helix bundle protein
MGIIIEESDETLFWLEMIEESQIINEETEIGHLKNEANELTSIFVSSVKTLKSRLNH